MQLNDRPRAAMKHYLFKCYVCLAQSMAQVVAMRAVQTCENGAIEWVNISSADGTRNDTRTLAAGVDIAQVMISAMYKH